MFEGLGLGSRLSLLPLPKHMTWTLYVAAIAYSLVTPLGLAIGLGVRTTSVPSPPPPPSLPPKAHRPGRRRYDPNTATANIVSGTLDSFSSGILLYTGLVELIAHDFVFNKKMVQDASWGKLLFSIGCVVTGAGFVSPSRSLALVTVTS